jgi:hypothetical protein
MSDKKEQGFIKKEITLIIDTRCGDHWQNKVDCQFTETKDGKTIIVEPKENENNN